MTATKSVRGENFFVAMKNFDWGRTAQESEHADRGTVNTGVGNRYEIAPLTSGILTRRPMQSGGVQICPAGGTYTFSDNGNKVSEIGTASLSCSIENHEYPDNSAW
jgi:hypothetical protein